MKDRTDKKLYWMYAPGEGSNMWNEFHDNGIMGIGWDELGDFKQYPTKESMNEIIKVIYGEEYSYKNAGYVLLLGIPKEEQAQFIIDRDIGGMSNQTVELNP